MLGQDCLDCSNLVCTSSLGEQDVCNIKDGKLRFEMHVNPEMIPCLTEYFTILEPHNPSIRVF